MIPLLRRAGHLLLVAFVAALAVPVLVPSAAGDPATSGATTIHAPLSPLSYVPALIHAPWSMRVGFDPARSSQVQSARPADGLLTVVVTLLPRDLSFYTPPNPGAAPLTTAQVADRFAISAAQYQSFEDYLTSQGLTILHSWPDRMSITVTGPAAAVNAAFGTSEWSGVWHGRTVRYAATLPHLPAPYSQQVAAISGLSEGFTSFSIPFHTAALPAAGAASSLQGRTTRFITPLALHVAYGLDALYNFSGSPHWSTGVGIALLLWGQGYSPSDLQTFYGNFYPSGFPPITLADYPVDGAPPPSAAAVNDPSGAAQELTLDLEWSGSEAPGATLDAVYAPDGPAANMYSPTDASMEDAVNEAVQTIAGVRVLSMSFGTTDGADGAFQMAFSAAFATAAQRGITVLAASGDNGGTSGASCAGQPAPQFPASSPQVVAVGGTALVLAESPLGAVTGIDSEPAWNGSGGGFSSVYPAPAWQKVGSAAAPIAASGHRGIPDVAGPAAFNSFYYNGAAAAGKGTSFATPMWAGMVAEMDAIHGTALGFLTPRLYIVGASEENGTGAPGLIDVTSGSTCLGPATTGWDETAGWGSPRAFLLYEDLVSTFVRMSLSTSTGTVAPGGAFQATVTVANPSKLTPIRNVVVEFELSASGFGGLCSGSLQRSNSTTDLQGNASVQLSVPSCFLGSQVTVTATIISGGYFAQTSTSLAVNLLGLAGFLAIIQVFPFNVIAFFFIILASVLIGWRLGEWRHRRERAHRPQARGPSPGSSPKPPGGTGNGGAASSRTAVAAGSRVAGVSAAYGPRGGIESRGAATPAGRAGATPSTRATAPVAPRGESPGTRRPGSAEAAAGSDEPSAAAAGSVPSHVLVPPAPPPPLATTKTSSLPRCSACGSALAFGDTQCVSCGTAVPPPGRRAR